MEHIQNNKTEDKSVRLSLERRRATAMVQEVRRALSLPSGVSSLYRMESKKTVEKKMSGAQRMKKASTEIRKNLNAYDRHYAVNFDKMRQQKVKKECFTPGANPFKWVSPAYKASTSSLKPEATVTSQTSRPSRQYESPHIPSVAFTPLSIANEEEPEKIGKMGIAHPNHPSTKLSDDQCQIIQNNLIYEFLKCQDGTGPQLKDIFVNDNVVWLKTANEYSRKWLYENIPRFEPWQGARLKIGRAFELKGLVRVITCLPKSMDDIESDKIFEMLKAQNKGLNTDKWTLIKTLPGPIGKTYVLQIDSESLKVLQQLHFEPFLGLSKVTFTLVTPSTDIQVDPEF
ncbi:unnamed protein product [Callosobruchus maculatus]|uniref:DUF4780 domain-containing protein n=1 Tax=Callosobruchus maculatus TaxID=64391 RepID=A0A653DIV1_CALMS|nr:unnamed protein product [Callosobruchus maculatus]